MRRNVFTVNVQSVVSRILKQTKKKKTLVILHPLSAGKSLSMSLMAWTVMAKTREDCKLLQRRPAQG